MRRAARAGARLVATPEATTYLGPHSKKAALAEPVDGPTHQRLAGLARELGITLLVGSVAERCPDLDGQPNPRSWNTSLLFGPDGGLLARYRKLHLFDVDLSDQGGVSFRESRCTAPGSVDEDVVVVDTELGRLGLSICFDMRFPELYRALVDANARWICVPSAFARATGPFHWEVLLRAPFLLHRSRR